MFRAVWGESVIHILVDLVCLGVGVGVPESHSGMISKATAEVDSKPLVPVWSNPSMLSRVTNSRGLKVSTNCRCSLYLSMYSI